MPRLLTERPELTFGNAEQQFGGVKVHVWLEQMGHYARQPVGRRIAFRIAASFVGRAIAANRLRHR